MLKLILNPFKEKNKYLISALLFIFTYLSLTILLSVYNHYTSNINTLQNEEINRGIEITITEESATSIFKDNSNIELYYPIYNNQKMLYQNQNVNFNTTDNITLVQGSNAENDNEIIISQSFSKSIKLDENNYNNELNFNYENTEYHFIIVGITDNNNADVYLKSEKFKEIFNPQVKSFYVLIANYKDVNNFLKQMINDGYIANLYNATNEEE